MFCPNCGNQLDDNVNFCPVCGCRLGDIENSAPVFPEHREALEQQAKPKKKINILGIYSSLIYALGIVLPFATTTALGFPTHMTMADRGSDRFFVLFFALSGVAASVAAMNAALMFFGGISLLMAFITRWGFDKNLAVYDFTKGAGYYILFIGAVCMIISAVIGLVLKHKKKDTSASPYPNG